ncbi:MAG TPA: Hsp20/alpha crystallin family protein [Bacteroidales bacterium]|nr:Hsp20/alpha crystallin family protein [Bacteroidales bacterium]
MLPIIRTRNFRPVFESDFFNEGFNSPIFGNGLNKPAVNIREDEKQFGIEVALPGLSKDDIKIEIEKDMLMISSERKDEKEESRDGYTRKEFGYCSFCKNFKIPENVEADKISAVFKNGILNIELPKTKEETKLSRTIKIS